MMKSEELRATNKPEYTKLYKQVEAMLNNLATTKSQIKNIEVDLALLEDDFDGICTIVYSEATGPEEDDFESEEANREMRRTKLRQEMKLKQSEVAKVENITRERVRQIESSAIKKLRYPKFGKELKKYVHGD